MPSKTIGNSVTVGVTLNATHNYNPLYVTGTINTATGDGVHGDNTQAWTVGNTGTIEAAAGNGVKLLGGGTVTNGASGATSALISGYNAAVYITTTAGTVANFGTLFGGANGDGVFLYNGGGSVTNGASGATSALISAGNFGILAENAAATVTNFATVAGGAYGVHLDGGRVINGSSATRSALISGGDGVGNAGGVLTLTNYGAIKGTAGSAILMQTGTANSIANFGLIEGTGTNSGGIQLAAAASGVITNSGSMALIAGAPFGIEINGSSATVINFGTIKGTSTSASQVTGVSLYGGSITNGAGTATGAVIDGVQYGALIGNAAGTVLNFGTIAATATGGIGLRLAAGGTIDNLGTITGPGSGIFLNSAASVTNGKTGSTEGYIAGKTGVNLQTPGTVINYGRIVAAAAGSGLYFVEGGTVHNFGTISGGTGVDFNFLNAGAIVVNGKSASTAGLISGVNVGVAVEIAGGTVTNFGKITGGTDGVSMFGSIAVVVDNFGSIGGGSVGAYLGGTAGARIVNSGAITGGSEGVHIRDAAGTVVNSGTGTIEGTTGSAINLTDGGTVIDSGTITGGGGTAVSFGGTGGNRLVLEPGYHLGGTVVGSGGATNTLALGSAASAGTVTAVLATEFVNFGTVTVNAGARWTLTGSSSLAGITLTDLGTLTNTGTLSGAGSLVVDPATLFNKGSIGLTVTLSGGGYLDNEIGGTITGAGDGVFGTLGAATIVNLGTVQGSAGAGIYLAAGGSVTNGSGTTTSPLIAGYDGIIVRNAPGTVANYAKISGSGIFDTGVSLEGGGSLTNRGTIAASGAQSYAVHLVGGSLTNGSSGAPGAVIAGSGKDGVLFSGAGSIANFGTIAATNTAVGIGVSFFGGGDRLVNAGRIIGAGGTAVSFGGTGGNLVVVDPGAVFSGIVNGGTGSNRLELGSAATVGTLSGLGTKYRGFSNVTIDAGARWVLSGSNTIGAGVTLADLGTLTNTGSLSGVGSFVVDPATLFNSGSIGMTVTLSGGGYLDNEAGGTVAITGVGVYGTLGAATIVNAGMIGGPDTGIRLWNGGAVTNHAGGTISGFNSAIDIRGAPGHVTNAGFIVGTGYAYAINLYFGTVDNQAGGTIAGHGGVAAAAFGFHNPVGAITVTNAGTILGTSGVGVYLTAGGSVANTGTGLIEGSTGVAITGSAVAVTNAGTIAGTGTAGLGIELAAGGTVIDSGTISGGSGTAVSFGGTGGNRLVLDPGYHLGGKVVGSTSAGATNTLELGSTASIGTVSGLGSEFVHFGTVTVDAGAQWVLSGSNTIGAGATLSNIGTLTDAGTLVDAGMIIGNSRLIVVSGGSELILSGGTARGTVLSGGTETVSTSGTGSGGTVASGGVERVYGRASWGAVTSGGQQIVESGGVASGVTVKHGGSQTVFSGGTTRATVLSGGVEYVHGTASGTIVDSGGAEIVYGKASGGTINGGRVEVTSGGTASGTVTFASGGTLQLDATSGFTVAVKGFAIPDQLDLRGIAFTSGATTESFEPTTSSSGILTVTSGTHSVNLTLLGTYTTSSFKLGSDGHGGTLVTDPPVAGAVSQLTFADIAPAGPHAGAATPIGRLSYWPGPIATNEHAHAGQTLLAAGPPGEHDCASHNSWLPAPR